MKLKRDTNFGEESPSCLKSGLRNLTNFDPSTQKVSKISTLMDSFSAKYILFELIKYRGVIFHEHEGGCKIWKGIDSLFKIDVRNLTNFNLSARKSQKFSF